MLINKFSELSLAHWSGFSFGVLEILTRLLQDLAELESDGGGRGDFVVPVEFGDFSVIGSSECVVSSS